MNDPAEQWLKRMQQHQVLPSVREAYVEVLDSCQGAAHILKQVTGTEVLDQRAVVELSRLLVEHERHKGAGDDKGS